MFGQLLFYHGAKINFSPYPRFTAAAPTGLLRSAPPQANQMRRPGNEVWIWHCKALQQEGRPSQLPVMASPPPQVSQACFKACLKHPEPAQMTSVSPSRQSALPCLYKLHRMNLYLHFFHQDVAPHRKLHKMVTMDQTLQVEHSIKCAISMQ